MKRLLAMTFVVLFFCFTVGTIAEDAGAQSIRQQQQDTGSDLADWNMEQMQQAQQQNAGFGGDFTRITVTQPSYYSQPSLNRPTSDSGSKNKTDSWGTSSDSIQTDYTTQRPADYGLFRDTGTSTGFSGPAPQTNQPAPNGLWIVDSTGLKRYPSFSLPLNGYIEEELTPGMEGNLTVEELYPNGQVHTFSMGYVQPFHVYKMWFTADIPGTHKARYNVDGYYSNIVEFYVHATEDQEKSKPEAEEATSVPMTGGPTTRVGGSYGSSSGYSSMTSQGGSVSISTSYG